MIVLCLLPVMVYVHVAPLSTKKYDVNARPSAFNCISSFILPF